ncbi:OmpA family protein [Fulvivirga sp. RKSG066]|nr:OmpA family protein [Fulvivirga aurantia]
MTVGVYAESKLAYAQRYAQQVSNMGLDAQYGFSSRRGYYYVYTFYSKNYKEAIAEMRKLRQKEGFSEAWVYVHSSSIGQPRKEEVAKKEPVEAKEKPETVKPGKENKPKAEESETEEVEENEAEEVLEEEEIEEEEIEEEEVSEEKEEDRLNVYFNVLNARTQVPIEGDVQVIDVERSKLLDVFEAGDTVDLPSPETHTGELALVVDNFGYRKNQIPFNYLKPDTSELFVRKQGDKYVVDFDMIRYRKGDIVTMYNVYFFQNASIMKPESKYELRSLLDMMKENPNYQIRVHGHTNGNAPGKIISPGDDKQYFTLSDDNKQGYGTAKKLSKERAEIVANYLIDNGVDESRIKTKGWGGKRMVHEKLGHRARHNVRVEIEILQD